MKWNNPGHEFDELGKFFQCNMGIYIYGAGEIGQLLYRRLEFLDCVKGFIDNGFREKKDVLYGKMVETIVSFGARLNDEICQNNIFIVAASRGNETPMLNQLRRLGNGKILDGKNLFAAASFMDFYLPIFALYSYGKLNIKEINVALTLRCTLRCKNCVACVPMNNSPKDYSLSMIKESVDDLFRRVDYVTILELAGGEPLLYRDLLELVEYIGEKYRDRCYTLQITTNGTILPSDELCAAVKRYHISFMLDDYRQSLLPKLSRITEIRDKLDKLDISYFVNDTEYWFDMGIGVTDNSKMSENELESIYTACSWNCMQLCDSKLYQCGLTFFAMEAGISHDEYSFPLNQNEFIGKKELLEYSYHYLPKGYADICKRCAGDYTINTHLVKAAVQQ